MISEIENRPTIRDDERHKEMIRKNRLANELCDIVGELIQTGPIVNSFEVSPEDALMLGTLWFVYEAEAILHNEDRISLEIENARENGWDYLSMESNYRPDHIHEARLKNELAISLAARGDYRGVKALMMDRGWMYVRICGSEGKQDGLRLLQVADKIPDFANPFILPNPAWVDLDDLE